MAHDEPITFHVPASAANLGPGFGMLGIAVDLPLHVTIEPRSDGQVAVERRGAASLTVEDRRHDPVLRGLRVGAECFEAPLHRGVTVILDGNIPRGTGLGTLSAGFAAGLGAAARLARRKWSPGEVLDQLVQIGGDPAHGAASLQGGLCTAVPTGFEGGFVRRHHVLQLPIHGGWHFVVLLPDVMIGTADSKRVLPPTLPHGVANRTAGRVQGLLHALAEGDEGLLGACLFDETHVPYRRSLYSGLEATLRAATEAGAAGATICGHGPSLVALTTDAHKAQAIAKAMVEAQARHGRRATPLVLQAAHYGALPMLPQAVR